MEKAKPLERHEVVSLIFQGLAINDGGFDVEVALQRLEPPPVSPHILTPKRAARVCRRRGGPPQRPSKLPQEPRAPRQLWVQLGKRIGYGRIGSVHDISILSSQVMSPASELDVSLEGPPYIPPLVAKVAFSQHTKSLIDEASMYEELETLQGVIMPRCYGLFETTVGGDFDVPPWKTSCKKNAKLKKTKKDKKIVVLLLEKLGNRIKPEYPGSSQSDYKISVKTKKEIFTMCNVLAHYGITHQDLRAANILKAPASPPGLESLECPVRHRKYNWRLIDFDQAVKSNLTKAVMNGTHGSQLFEFMVYWPAVTMFEHEDTDAVTGEDEDEYEYDDSEQDSDEDSDEDGDDDLDKDPGDEDE